MSVETGSISLKKRLNPASAIVAGIEKAGEGAEAMAGAFLHAYLRQLRTPARPDRAYIKSGGLDGSRPRLVVEKDLPEPLPNAWGSKTSVDVIVAAAGNLAEYLGDGWGIFEFPMTAEEALQKEWPFFILTREECEQAIETIKNYIVVDFNDFLGVVLGAYYPLYPKEDSPDPAWNEAARRANQIEKARWEAIKAKLEAEREAEWQAGLAACREEGVEILSADRKTGEIRFRLEGKERVSRPGWGEMPWEHPAGLAQAVRKWKLEAQYAARYYEEVIEPVRRGEEPFFTAGNFALYYTGRNRVECPENLIPHLIGIGGQGIKGIEKALGVRLHIVKVAPVSLGRKDKIWRLSPPDLPEMPGETS